MKRTLKSRKRFERVFRKGKRLSTPVVRLTYLRLDDPEDGLGEIAYVAPKRLGNAVLRNRCKRLLRESARAAGLPLDSYDVILFATPKTRDASVSELTARLEGCIRRIR